MAVALVTGARGFLGRHVCRELDRRGIDVFAISRSAQGADARSIAISATPSVADLVQILHRVEPSMVFHLAGTTNADPIADLYQANVVLGVQLMEAALRCDVRPTMVLVGSAAEYGRPVRDDGMVRETDPCAPENAYGISKLSQTLHGLAAFRRGLPVVAARLFNPIGVGAPSANLLTSVLRQLASAHPGGGQLTTGPLAAIRDFIDVSDAAHALVDLAHMPQACGQIVNLCTGIGTRVQGLVDQLVATAALPIRHEIDLRLKGTSDLDVVVGDPERHRAFGLLIPPPDLERILGAMLAAALKEKLTRGDDT
jgi:GDP-4-dehydro-6-deoxy-D-mannose reductase